jgi:hypothetical protein
MNTPAPLTPLSGDVGTPPPVPQPAPIATPPSPAAQKAQARTDMELRRERLAGELAQLQWDLGGLTYEMAIRDHFRLDVLTHQAGLLQEIDAELAETERLLALDESSAAGSCPVCSAMFARGSSFCWRCGTQLMTQTAPAVAPAPTSPGPAPFDPAHPVFTEQPTTAQPVVDPHEPATQAFTPVQEHVPAAEPPVLSSGDPLATAADPAPTGDQPPE